MRRVPERLEPGPEAGMRIAGDLANSGVGARRLQMALGAGLPSARVLNVGDSANSGVGARRLQMTLARRRDKDRRRFVICRDSAILTKSIRTVKQPPFMSQSGESSRRSVV